MIGDVMKKILLKEYKNYMGIFIDLSNNKPVIVDNFIYYDYENLLINHKELLNKDNKYYIYCNGGIKSRKVVNILEFYGYDVTLVYKE